MPVLPTPATIAVVVREGRVLLVRRADPPDAGRWSYPGGRIEPGERIVDSAVRELMEETGIEATPLDVLAAGDVMDRDAAGELRYHYVLVAVLCRLIAGEARARDDVIEVGWFTPEEIAHIGTAASVEVDRVARRAIELTRQLEAAG